MQKRNPPNAGKGRRKGSKNKRIADVEHLARRVFDKDYEKQLKARIREGNAPQMETLLAGHLYGLAKKTVALGGDVPKFVGSR